MNLRRYFMKLDDIGFYTLTEKRCAEASSLSSLSRCELVLSSKCNFNCPYCRRVGGEDLSLEDAKHTVILWAGDKLKAIRFSGGEPTLYPGIFELVQLSRTLDIERIAISTNGSASRETYKKLWLSGVNDFSISLDACCAEDNKKMTGGREVFDTVIENIKWLSQRTYVSVGVVLTDDNAGETENIIDFASSLGVSDIRIIPAAQNGNRLKNVSIDASFLSLYPILTYRFSNALNGKRIRGIEKEDCHTCGLVLDDMAVNDNKHYPCIIYMRESGKEIGKVGPNMRQERLEWFKTHDTYNDPICKNNCLDVCVEYNNKFKEYRS